MIDMITPEKLSDPHINDDADHLADALRYLRSTVLRSIQGREKYVCECFKCDMTYYTSIKQCNCPHCGCDDEHFRCTELK